MKIILALLTFLICLPIGAERQTNFNSVTETCSYATEGNHNVQENAYKRLLASLKKEKHGKQKTRELQRGTGQR